MPISTRMFTTNRRTANATKLNTQYLYSRPYRWAIPALQGLLFAFNIAITAYTLQVDISYYYRNSHFARYSLTAIVLLIYSIIELFRRYQRLTSSLEATISSSVVLVIWLLYGLLGSFVGEFNLVSLMYCAPSIVVAAVYTALAGRSLRLENKAKKQPKDVELDERRVDAEPPQYSVAAGSSRPPFPHRSTSQEVLTVDARPEKQSWSPLAGR